MAMVKSGDSNQVCEQTCFLALQNGGLFNLSPHTPRVTGGGVVISFH